jgi:integrase
LNSAPDPETKAFWACCALAGLRQSEAANLTFKQILIEGSAKIIGLPARGNAPSSVEIGPDLLEILQNLSAEDSNLLFPNLPKHASQRTRELQTVDPHLTFNMLRYSFGANLILRGEGLEAVRRKMRFAMLEEVAAVYGGLLK